MKLDFMTFDNDYTNTLIYQDSSESKQIKLKVHIQSGKVEYQVIQNELIIGEFDEIKPAIEQYNNL